MKKATKRKKHASLEELRATKDRGEIRSTPEDAPTYDVPKEFWKNARPYLPVKKPVNLRVDEDVLDFFRAQGKGHLTRMNAVLHSYVNHKRDLPGKTGRAKS